MAVPLKNLLPKLRELVEAKLAGHESCHDFDHTLRVLANAECLMRSIAGANAAVVRAAALLHDYARPEEYASRGKVCHAALGADTAHKLLLELDCMPDAARAVAAAIRSHRYRGKNHPSGIEAEILYDADKLDSLGAVGIGRAFLFAGKTGARLHNSRETALNSQDYSREDTAYREYLVKLSKLPPLMKTAAGRETARRRSEFMQDFFDRLNAETAENQTKLP